MKRTLNKNIGFNRIGRGLVMALAVIALAVLPLLTCATPPRGVTTPRDATPHTLVLLHTNDHHGAVLPNGGKGGLAERAAFVKIVRADYEDVLLIDAGDINTGLPCPICFTRNRTLPRTT
jgi:5'-nucleotidase/UDP-sugar diphosphatase